jgi:Mn2+/Fe2+ NRAMP family transporter
MKRALQVLLGVVTSIGGFVEVGSISTSAQAGALFGFRLIWAIVLATVCLAFLIEMSGRLAAVSHHTVSMAVREHLGIHIQIVPFLAEILLDMLVLTAEVGGMCIALHLVTGRPPQLFAIPVALLVWALLWFGRFEIVEDGAALLGLVTLSFVVAMVKLHPDWRHVLAGAVPSLPHEQRASYGFLAVSILGATISPYMVNFYSSGAVEEKWDLKSLGANRITSVLGMGFGSMVSLAVLVVAALVLRPRGIRVDAYEQAAPMLTGVLGRPGFYLFAASLGIGCLGAALELALNLGYLPAQVLGWNWGEDLRPHEDARFCVAYSTAILGAAFLILAGLDPLRITLMAMSLTVIIMPLIVLPFLVIMNDEKYLGAHTNGHLGNAVVVFTTVLGALLALVAIPLQVLGS